MKRAIAKVQLLKHISKKIAAGDQVTTLKNILEALENKQQKDLIYLEKQLVKLFPLMNIIKQSLNSSNQFLKLLSLLELETFTHNQIIFYLGDIGRKMYFVLSGKLLVFPSREINRCNSSRELQKGEHFGEISLHHRIPRTITVQCKEDSILLSANFEIYSNFIGKAVENTISDQFQFIANMNIFQGWTPLTLSLISHHFRELIFQRNQLIYSEGEKDQSLYLIRNGEIILSKQTIIKSKKQENGLICLSSGQCFGDFEFLDNQVWLRNKDHIKSISRRMTAKVTTETKVYQFQFNSYLLILEEYHRHTLQYFLANVKQIIILRLKDVEKKAISQSIKVEEDSERTIEKQERKAFEKAKETKPKIVLDEIQFQPTTSHPNIQLTSIIRSQYCKNRSFKRDIQNDFSQFQNSNSIKFNFTPRLEPTLMKFDRGHKILLIKKLKEASILPDRKENFIYPQRSVLSSLSKLRFSRNNEEQNEESGAFIKSFVNSRPISPNYLEPHQQGNFNLFQKRKRTSSFKFNDNLQRCNFSAGFPRFMSQSNLNRRRIHKSKFEREYDQINNNSSTDEVKQPIDLYIQGKQ